jgi:hypothetical protein
MYPINRLNVRGPFKKLKINGTYLLVIYTTVLSVSQTIYRYH